MAQHTVRSQAIRTIFWVNFGLTVVATLYFGWHYIADDLAGAAIAIIAFRLAARATGHRLPSRRRAPQVTEHSPQPAVAD